MQSFSRFQLIRSLTWLAVFFVAYVAGAQNDVCVNSIGGLGGTPTFDGQVEGDVGWNNAVRINVSGDMGSTTATKMQMGIVGSTLYLGLVVSAPTVSPDTTVVLGFSPNDGMTAHDWRLHISPFDVAPPADGTKNNPPFAVMVTETGKAPATPTLGVTLISVGANTVNGRVLAGTPGPVTLTL